MRRIPRVPVSDHGAIDLIVDRREMRDKLAAMLAILMKRPKAA